MPKLLKFKISNFRGIQDATFTVDEKSKSDVITLIGLNESGKTTVLEALSHFSTGDRTIPNLLAQGERQDHLISLIPIDMRSHFSGSVSITAEILVEKQEAAEYAKKVAAEHGVDIKVPDEDQKITVTKSFEFKDSKYTEQTNYWNNISFTFKKKRALSFSSYRLSDPEHKKIWASFVANIKSNFYELVYFPTFIVDMPSRIYLETHVGESNVNLYYRKVIEDVLFSIDPKLDLKKHVVDRLKAAKTEDGSANWFSIFWGKPERKLVDSVLEKIQAAINKEVIGNWSKVFSQAVASRAVKLEWSVDAEKGDSAYLSFGITDGVTSYAVHERSLGFRWFFSYLLFTQFRSKSQKKTIFLFDEPAANLHARAQMQLLSSIDRIVMNDNKVIYSTHSPHMINPAWLNGAHIVENMAVDFDKGEDVSGLDTKPTDIRVIRYGNFVGQYPKKQTYFQPVWEKLLYETPPIVGQGPFLCVEGISDFHLFRYVLSRSKKKLKFSLVPGVGAGGFSSSLPALYGVGAKFVLLLDDDKAGRKERARYVDNGILSPSQVFTVGDAHTSAVGKKLETLITSDTKALIAKRFDGKSGKPQIAMYLAEINSDGTAEGVSEDTFLVIESILEWASVSISKL